MFISHIAVSGYGTVMLKKFTNGIPGFNPRSSFTKDSKNGT